MERKTSKNNIFKKIICFPIYFFKYIFLGVEFIFYLIFKFFFNLFKYFYIGVVAIFSVIFKPFTKLSKGKKTEHLKDHIIDGDTINSQKEVDEIFTLKPNKRNQKRLRKIEKKKLKKEKKEEQRRLKLEKKKSKSASINNEQTTLDSKKSKKEKRIEARRLKKEKKEEQKRLKLEKKQNKKAEKAQRLLDKKEAKLNKKKKNEAYVNEKYKGEKKPEKKTLKDILYSINHFPDKIKKYFQNTLLYKNAKNKKDKNRQILLIDFDGADAVKSEQKKVYEYVGKNAEGKVVKDYFPAFSRVEVHSFLLSEGYEVYSIRTSKLINLLHKSTASVTTRFKTKDLIFFLTQLSTYIKAGIPLVESLKILSRQFKNKTYQKIFRAMIYDLTMGESFSSAMNKQGNGFPQLLINMIKASEMTGELPEALDDMAEYYTQADQARKQMITALTYPAIVFIFALGVITFIMLYVIPKFVDIYKSMDESQIPSFTLLVMDISYFLQENILYIFIGIVIFIVVISILYKNVKAFRWAVQWVAMHLPVVKNIIIYNEVQMFTKTFSSLLSHSVFITDTLEILSKITNNEIYKMLVRDTAANLERGEKISAAYKDQWAFPIPAYEMIVTGERTGQLAEMMKKVSVYYQDLHKNTVTRLKAFIEPILIVFLTVVVGFIVLSIVIPMFNMYNQIV